MSGRYGRYQVEGLLGKGAMAEVYRAFDPDEQRAVALKVMAPQGAAGRVAPSDLLARFQREAEAYRQLEHPHIVRLYDVGVTDDNRPYLVTELVEGVSLDQHLAQVGVLAPTLAARIGMQIAEALDHAHRAGFVHRDVKPANIIMTDEGDAKLMDFGIARTAKSSLTAEGAFLGSLIYSSPEQVSVQDIDGRSDIFSLGTTLFILLTGRNPFARKEVDETIEAITSKPVAAVSWLRVELHPEWDVVLAKAMAKAKEDRYPTGAAMSAALAPLVRSKDTAPLAAHTEWDLVCVLGPEAGQRFPLTKRSTVIGRRNADLVLSDARVSSRHCIVEVDGPVVRLRDLGSMNGTFVDGVKIDVADLSPRNEVRVGPDVVVRVLPRVAESELTSAALDSSDGDAGTSIMPGAIDYVLVIEDGPRKGARLILGSSILLSRADGKGRLDDPSVSMRHAIIDLRADGHVWVKDLGSRNGTYLDKRPVTEGQIQAGQRLHVGSTVLVLRRAEGV